jgi:hypothetical protein
MYIQVDEAINIVTSELITNDEWLMTVQLYAVAD